MSKWDSNQYLKFNSERTQPAIDLLMKVKANNLNKIIDIGCGPGNSTAILKQYFSDADIMGVDSSVDMIENAKKTYPDDKFMLLDVQKDIDQLDNNYDLIFSNACLQWISNHEVFIPQLFELLNVNGALAVQIPMNGNAPLYKVVRNIVGNSKWNIDFRKLESNKTLEPDQYFNILSKLTDTFDIWETTYYHRMKSHDDLINWIKGTMLRPYLNQMDVSKQMEFLSEVKEQTKEVYPIQENGEIIFHFRRFFFVAYKSGNKTI